MNLNIHSRKGRKGKYLIVLWPNLSRIWSEYDIYVLITYSHILLADPDMRGGTAQDNDRDDEEN